MANSEKNEGEIGQAGWKFHSEGSVEPRNSIPAQGPANIKPVVWTASEFIEHDKTAGWFVILMLITFIIAAAIYFLTKDLITIATITLGGIAFGVFAARKPRILEYEVSQTGIRIDKKTYPYSSFKAFSVVNEGAVESVWLMPLKRFMPIITVYFAPNDASKIVEAVSKFLPFQEYQPDTLDRFMQRIRF